MGASAPRSPTPAAYRGRFAPAPTGPLHFGSLVAAVAGFADARAQNGHWLLRIEDLDQPREVPGAAREILRTLTAFGLRWDGDVLYQSTRSDAYGQAAERLTRLALTYPCACTRTDIARAGKVGPEGPIYPGTCRRSQPPQRQGYVLRLRSDGPPIQWCDRIQGEHHQTVSQSVGDFVIRRRGGLYAYHLAVVVDDAFQGINQVVRGADLLGSTPRQILIQRALGLPTPHYAHIPLALDPLGRKLSKSLEAAPVDPSNPLPALRRAWEFLGQPPVPVGDCVERFWIHATAHWNAALVPRLASRAVQRQATLPGTPPTGTTATWP